MPTVKQVAIKQIPVSSVAEFKFELDALQRMNHANVMRLYHYFPAPEDNRNVTRLVLELCAESLDARLKVCACVRDGRTGEGRTLSGHYAALLASR